MLILFELDSGLVRVLFEFVSDVSSTNPNIYTTLTRKSIQILRRKNITLICRMKPFKYFYEPVYMIAVI